MDRRPVCRGCRGNVSCWRRIADEVAVLHSRLCKRLCCLLHDDGRWDRGPDSKRSARDSVYLGRRSLVLKNFIEADVTPQSSMTEDGLLALQRHFEEQYGKLEIPGVKRKNKRKRTGETEPPTEETADWEQEWGGIGDDKASNPDPKVVEFKETQETDQVDKKSYKSFMVFSIIHIVTNTAVVEITKICQGKESCSRTRNSGPLRRRRGKPQERRRPSTSPSRIKYPC